MINIPEKIEGAYSSNSIQSINNRRILGAVSAQNAESINGAYTSAATVSQWSAQPQPANTQPQWNTTTQQANIPPQDIMDSFSSEPFPIPAPAPVQPPVDRPTPALPNPMRKGQKCLLETSGRLSSVNVCLGWNVKRGECELDVSAFLLDSSGKVPGDDWFVFYGQPNSPEHSTVFSAYGASDRETISVDFNRLNTNISKIVFVLTINDALEKHLNFSMVKDAYIRIINTATNTCIVSFKLEEYYANVTSMMIGELYLHNGAWKFNAVGSGVARDLAGLCELYGVQVI